MVKGAHQEGPNSMKVNLWDQAVTKKRRLKLPMQPAKFGSFEKYSKRWKPPRRRTPGSSCLLYFVARFWYIFGCHVPVVLGPKKEGRPSFFCFITPGGDQVGPSPATIWGVDSSDSGQLWRKMRPATSQSCLGTPTKLESANSWAMLSDEAAHTCHHARSHVMMRSKRVKRKRDKKQNG